MGTDKSTEITDDFGRFLISRNVVDEEVVRESLKLQRSKATVIGKLAMEEKILTLNQVFDILEKKLVKQKFFCQIAVELGFITKAIAHKLLQLQKKRLPPLGDILLEMKAINQYDLERELAFFKDINKDNE
jgi:hypothetical protein|tara:strand:+ start:38 stop:430 length:393 start_codon:yes stop_codon:yes gene_type:complete